MLKIDVIYCVQKYEKRLIVICFYSYFFWFIKCGLDSFLWPFYDNKLRLNFYKRNRQIKIVMINIPEYKILALIEMLLDLLFVND